MICLYEIEQDKTNPLSYLQNYIQICESSSSRSEKDFGGYIWHNTAH